MKKNILSLFVMLLVWTGNNYSQLEDEPMNDSIIINATGRRILDEHGCNKGVQATWSILKGCVQIWNAGMPFSAYGTNQEQSRVYVIVSVDRKKVEIFASHYFKESIILDLVKTKKRTASFYENKQEKVKIYHSKRKYYISINNEPVYIQEKK